MESGQKMILSNGWWPIQQFSVLAILAKEEKMRRLWSFYWCSVMVNDWMCLLKSIRHRYNFYFAVPSVSCMLSFCNL